MGLCHTVAGLMASSAPPISHLHAVGAHLATALPSGPDVAVMGLPRQLAGASGSAAVQVCVFV